MYFFIELKSNAAYDWINRLSIPYGIPYATMRQGRRGNSFELAVRRYTIFFALATASSIAVLVLKLKLLKDKLVARHKVLPSDGLARSKSLMDEKMYENRVIRWRYCIRHVHRDATLKSPIFAATCPIWSAHCVKVRLAGLVTWIMIELAQAPACLADIPLGVLFRQSHYA